MTPTTDLAASAVLASAVRLRAEADAAEVGLMLQVAEWCRIHEVTDEQDAATWHEVPLLLGGEGSPMVAEFCVAELGAALRTTTDSARTMLGHCLELVHRLPRTWERVLAGRLPVWRARRIADQTLPLSPEAVAYVDAQVAPFAHTVGPAATERLVEEAMVRFMPEAAAEIAERAAESRGVEVVHDRRTGSGLSWITATLDTPDALDLDAALQDGAAALRAGGSEDSLDVRRALALGDLARGQQALPFPGTGHAAPAPPARHREVVLYVHLDPTSDLVRSENAGGQVVTKDQLARWVSTGDAKVIVKPVIDLGSSLSTSAYAIPERTREHVILRDRTCIFPGCTRSARRCDLDHLHPYEQGGATSTDNLAALCRRHHRHKTFGRWSYTVLEPGVYLWRSPLGRTYLRDRHGTHDLTPPPPEPPPG